MIDRENCRKLFIAIETAALSRDHTKILEVFQSYTDSDEKLASLDTHSLIAVVRGFYRFRSKLPDYETVFSKVSKLLSEKIGDERKDACLIGLI